MDIYFYADTQYLLNQSQTIANISNWSVNITGTLKRKSLFRYLFLRYQLAAPEGLKTLAISPVG